MMMTTTSSLVNSLSTGHVFVVVVVIIVIIGGQTADSWPLGGAALYQCCCDECRRECFSCRNTNYTCNCAECSCYASTQPDSPDQLADAQTLIEKLFRMYSSQSRDQTNPRHHHHHQQQQQQHHHHRPPSARRRQGKVHGRHGNGSHVATVEGQDANRTKKQRLAPPVGDPGDKVQKRLPVT